MNPHSRFTAGQPYSELRSKLIAYQSRGVTSGHHLEGVSVAVWRGHVFRNEVLSPSGKRFATDEPIDFGGGGTAPDPAELLLAALGASLSVSITARAALSGLEIATLHIELIAQVDTRSFFDPNSDAPVGLVGVKGHVTLTAPAGLSATDRLMEESIEGCPVLRSLALRPVITYTIRSDTGADES
jgi:pyruvate dehydrogenase E2 component (dihydrolipoamide acetyltransferase)